MKFKQRTILRPATGTEQAYQRHLRRMLSLRARIGAVSMGKPARPPESRRSR